MQSRFSRWKRKESKWTKRDFVSRLIFRFQVRLCNLFASLKLNKLWGFELVKSFHWLFGHWENLLLRYFCWEELCKVLMFLVRRLSSLVGLDQTWELELWHRRLSRLQRCSCWEQQAWEESVSSNWIRLANVAKTNELGPLRLPTSDLWEKFNLSIKAIVWNYWNSLRWPR